MDWRWEAATRDRATGLPNAAIFRDRLAQALENGRRRGQPVCVMVATVGPGDVREVGLAGDRIGDVLRGSDTVARFGAWDLALILPDLGDPDDVLAVVDRIRAAAGGRVLGVGFAVSPDDAADAESLLFLAHRRRDEQAA